jgi:tripartite-type tricarboxylate transporter receptor subunit TctC
MQATSSTMAINVSMHKKLPYEPLKDLVPVALLSSSPFFLVVNPDSPIKSVADLIAAAKAKPNGLNYGSGGPGSMHHLSTELLESMANIKMTHVPYKATPPAMNDLIAGHIQVLFGDTTSTLPMIQQGRLRGIAVSTAKRSPAAMDVPAVAETVPGFESASWQMLVAPGATPPDVIALLNREIHTIFSDPATINELERRGIGPALTGTPEETNAFVKKEIVRWRGVVQRAGLEGSQ